MTPQAINQTFKKIGWYVSIMPEVLPALANRQTVVSHTTRLSFPLDIAQETRWLLYPS